MSKILGQFSDYDDILNRKIKAINSQEIIDCWVCQYWEQQRKNLKLQIVVQRKKSEKTSEDDRKVVVENKKRV